MVRIPTPVPEYVRDWVGQFLNNSLPLILYRTALIIVGLTLLYGALLSGALLVGLIVTTTFGALYAEDLRQTVSDIWNLNYWVLRT
jgi:uncharacterized membrane protein